MFTQVLFRKAPHSAHFIERFLLIAPHEGHRIPSCLRRDGLSELAMEVPAKSAKTPA